MLRKIVKILIILVAVLLAALISYMAYVLITYDRLPDNMVLAVHNPSTNRISSSVEYRIVSWNIGFGAYEQDYDFFMDGGRQSWAKSKDALDRNMGRIATELSARNADLYLIQEVDIDGTRSYHLDETLYLKAVLGDFTYVISQDWDSPFLALPLLQPHGKNKSAIMTFSRFSITDALRRSLPLENSVMKYIDLDRCYSISRIPAENGKELVLFNLHLSAYTSDGKIAIEQLRMLLDDIQTEYEKGNWCIAGGDFNKDLLGHGYELFGVTGSDYSWAQPIPEETFDGYDVTLIGPYDPEHPVASCRNADSAYWHGQYQVTVDGFLVTPNVTVKESHVIDLQFMYSDHNPVHMTFILD